MRNTFASWLIVVAGLAVAAYGLIGIGRHGFYVSGRGSLGQTEGGLAPLLLVIGLIAVLYGVIDLKLKARNPDKQVDQDQADREK